MNLFRVAFEPGRPWLECRECGDRATVQYTYLHDDGGLRITGYCLGCAKLHALVYRVPIPEWGLVGGTKSFGAERYAVAVENTLENVSTFSPKQEVV